MARALYETARSIDVQRRRVVGVHLEVEFAEIERRAGQLDHEASGRTCQAAPHGVTITDHEAAEFPASGCPIDTVDGDLSDRAIPLRYIFDDEHEIVIS